MGEGGEGLGRRAPPSPAGVADEEAVVAEERRGASGSGGDGRLGMRWEVGDAMGGRIFFFTMDAMEYLLY